METHSNTSPGPDAAEACRALANNTMNADTVPIKHNFSVNPIGLVEAWGLSKRHRKPEGFTGEQGKRLSCPPENSE